MEEGGCHPPPPRSRGWLVLDSRRWGRALHQDGSLGLVYRNVSRSLLVMGPRVGGSLGTKASGDSFSCVANTRGPSLGFTNGGRVCLHLSEQGISQDTHIRHH